MKNETDALNDTNVCKLCQNTVGKYVCPKCNILYCSLNCYRSANHQNCSEQFYRDSVIEELKLNENSSEDKMKMVSILKANYSRTSVSDAANSMGDLVEESPIEACDSDDDNEIPSLQERLAGIDLDDTEQVWAQLDEDERKEFIAMTQDYKSKNLEQNWKAWWTHSYNNKVQELGAELNTYKTRCPVLCDIFKFEGICKKNVPVCVEYNLHNIIVGYAFVTRYFNGEYNLFPRETMSFIAIISTSLKSHQDFKDSADAIKSVEDKIMENDWIICEPENISDMNDDFVKIISGPLESDPNYYIIAALCDMYNLLKKSVCKKREEADNALSKAFVDEHFPASKIHTLKELKLYTKRIGYFISYVHNTYSK